MNYINHRGVLSICSMRKDSILSNFIPLWGQSLSHRRRRAFHTVPLADVFDINHYEEFRWAYCLLSSFYTSMFKKTWLKLFSRGKINNHQTKSLHHIFFPKALPSVIFTSLKACWNLKNMSLFQVYIFKIIK